MKLTFRYNSMLNFIQVSFFIFLFLGLGLGSVIGLGFKVRVNKYVMWAASRQPFVFLGSRYSSILRVY